MQAHPVPLVLGVEIHVNLPKYAVSVAVLEVAQKGRLCGFQFFLIGIPQVHRHKQAAGAHGSLDISWYNLQTSAAGEHASCCTVSGGAVHVSNMSPGPHLHEEVHVAAQVWIQVCRCHGKHFHRNVGVALKVDLRVGVHASTWGGCCLGSSGRKPCAGVASHLRQRATRTRPVSHKAERTAHKRAARSAMRDVAGKEVPSPTAGTWKAPCSAARWQRQSHSAE